MTADLTGPALDAAVARALGWTMLTPAEIMQGVEVSNHTLLSMPEGLYHYRDRAWWEQVPWSPSTDIRDAWEVVEHMRALGWGIHLESGRIGFACQWFDEDGVPAAEATALTGPLAICLAAVAALGQADAGE